METILCGKISFRRNFEENCRKSSIFINICATMWSNTLHYQPATVLPQKCLAICNLLTTGASLLLVKYITPNIYVQSHHINKILKEYSREQINYNYFIIKYKNFF